MQRLIPLEMSYDYPVDWNYQRIIRDLVQNFYDSIGRKNFYRDFIYETGEVSNYSFDLVMKCKGYPFSYEWLTFI